MITFLRLLYFFLCIAVVALVPTGCEKSQSFGVDTSTDSFVLSGDFTFREAFERRKSGLWAGASATIERVLSDDLKDSQHQRFIVRLDNGQTLLIAHNIDIASRVIDLQVGGRVSFYGRYEYNDKGGVVHWTHRDPDGRVPGGWIEYNKIRYQ